MRFQKILVVYSRKKSKKHREFVKKITDFFIKRKESVKFICIDDLTREKVSKNDLIITIGGDGTFIRTNHLVIDEYILGINSERDVSEGALCGFDEGDFYKLKDVLEGKNKIISKERIDVIKNQEEIPFRALNELYIGALTQFHTSRYKIIIENNVEEQRSSGVLFSTSNGSSAWYKSAGGKKFGEGEIRFLVREPFFSRIFNPKLISGSIKKGEKVKILSSMYEGGVCVVDSDKIIDFKYGDLIILKISQKSLNVVEAI